MLRLVLAVWLALSAQAMAQVVTVRSGQHADHARLVLTFPEPGGWDFGRTADGYGFRTRASRWRYDVSTVFERLPRDRLAAVWTDPETGVLRLGLACACHALATPFRPGIVVIEIRDGPAPAESPFEAALTGSGNALPPLQSVPALRPRQRPAELAPPSPLPAPDLDLSPVQTVTPRSTPMLPLRPAFPQADALRQTLMRDLARSFAAGAVAPVGRLPVPPDAKGAGDDTPMPWATGLGTPADQLRVRQAGTDPVADMADNGDPCIADERLDLGNWGLEGPVGTQIAQARSGILGEFDRPDRERTLQLIRLNLHLGFGAEARNLLSLWAPDDPEVEVLAALGHLVDGGQPAGTFRGMNKCPGSAALWAVLAGDETGNGNTAAVLRGFSALPLWLRRHLGPGLASRYLDDGDAATATAIREAIDRAPGPHGEGLALLDADIDLAEGRIGTAEKRLETVVAVDGPAAAKALASLVDSVVGRGGTPDAAQLVALEAMLREVGGGTAAPDLQASLARGLAVSGAALQAFALAREDDPEQLAGLWSLVAARGDAIEFATLALAPPGLSPAALPTDVRLDVAERLLAEGYPDSVASWADGLSGPKADLLRARTALALRDGRSVLRHLAGLDSPDAQGLRAAAHELLGDLEAAIAAWSALERPDEVNRLRFLQRRWDALGEPQDTALGRLISARTGGASATPEVQDGVGPSLAAARALVEASTAVRSGVADVLSARALPDG